MLLLYSLYFFIAFSSFPSIRFTLTKLILIDFLFLIFLNSLLLSSCHILLGAHSYHRGSIILHLWLYACSMSLGSDMPQ